LGPRNRSGGVRRAAIWLLQLRPDHLSSRLRIGVVIAAQEVAVAVQPWRDAAQVLGGELQAVVALVQQWQQLGCAGADQ
jgi:hypothetical protein